MKILVTGITGYIGSRLAPRLQGDGHELRGFARSHHAPISGVPIVSGDAVSGRGLDQALEGIDVAYYLVHSMEPSGAGEEFGMRERAAAENFASAAQRNRVGRVIYLGGPMPDSAEAPPHLASRHAVERILLSCSPCCVALRASIVIGAGSRSFRFLVRLVERMPVIPLPGWRDNRTRPLDERDVIEMLARAATNDRVCGEPLDIAGPDVVTYEELINRIRDHMLISRPTISLGRLTATPIASRVAAVITGERHELIGPLMEGLGTDLLPRDDRAQELFGIRLHSLDAAIERALRDWEAGDHLAAR
jgi:uncharacterized protein YbjT (DUF2867 family)